MRLDLTQARTDAGLDEDHVVEFGGVEYLFPAVLPVVVGELLTVGQGTAALRAWIGEEQGDALLAAGLGAQDLQLIAEQLYGLGEGESRASSVSSRKRVTPSRPTSPATTRRR